MLSIALTIPFAIFVAIFIFFLYGGTLGSEGLGVLLGISCLLGVPSVGLVLLAIGLSWRHVRHRYCQPIDLVAFGWSCLCALGMVGGLLYAIL